MATLEQDASLSARGPVFNFDIYGDALLREDLHAGYLELAESTPGVFWTPANGGHWVVLDAAANIEALRHPELFSSSQLSIPKRAEAPRMIPESLDPPEHKRYRQFLRDWFESSAIAPRETRVRYWADTILDGVVESGECEFVEAVASRMPVSVFMEMFGLPLERIDEFRALITDYFKLQGAPGVEARTQQIRGALAELIQMRMAAPQDDLLSAMIAGDFEGRRLAFEELMSIGFLFLLAGLDTVTVALTFGMRHLAGDPVLQSRLRAEPQLIGRAAEEFLRRYSFANVPRLVTEDTTLAGARMAAGDMVHCVLPMVGLDDALNPDAATVSVDRMRHRHAAFGTGIHTCLGLHLARMELRVLYERWLARTGTFRIDIDQPPPKMRAGTVMACESLWLRWDQPTPETIS